jgi:hypothetical protein
MREQRTNADDDDPRPPPPGSPAAALVRGIGRFFGARGYGLLTEFPLANGRRADLIGLDPGGAVAIVEIKSSPADLRADGKWPDYLDFCDAFYFGVGLRFPLALLPARAGIIVADAYDGALVRPAPEHRLAPARRKALTLRFARIASARLTALTQPSSFRSARPD